VLVDAAIVVGFLEVADEKVLEVFSVALVAVERAESLDDGGLVLDHELLEVLVVPHDFNVLIENFVLGLYRLALDQDKFLRDTIVQVVLARFNEFFVE